MRAGGNILTNAANIGDVAPPIRIKPEYLRIAHMTAPVDPKPKTYV